VGARSGRISARHQARREATAKWSVRRSPARRFAVPQPQQKLPQNILRKFPTAASQQEQGAARLVFKIS